MVERVQSEKDDAQEFSELMLHKQALALDQERQTILDQQLTQQQHRQQLEQARDKLLEDLEQRQEEYAQMESKFQSHLRSARATDDDLTAIAAKLNKLFEAVHLLFGHDVETEAWVVEEVVLEILESPIQPGLVINGAFGKLYDWVKRRNQSWATRIRQQLTAFMARQSCQDLERAKEERIEKMSSCLDDDDPTKREQVKEIVGQAIQLNWALKSQDAWIETMTIEKGCQFDAKWMISVSGHEGVVSQVISPPFIATEADHRFVLIPARVFCV
ncbi:hypothetical protein G6F56_010978 [Rhizopus delemar]|nr:hypothetical protein G6F56_010978 [Rhizopus delemar]